MMGRRGRLGRSQGTTGPICAALNVLKSSSRLLDAGLTLLIPGNDNIRYVSVHDDGALVYVELIPQPYQDALRSRFVLP